MVGNSIETKNKNCDSTHFLLTIDYPQQNYPHPILPDRSFTIHCYDQIMVTRFTTIFLRSIRGFLLWGSLVFLIGCSSSNQWNEPPPIEEPDSADLMILNAVANISENIRKLETNDISLSSPTQPQPMDKKERLIDIKWNGPLETLLLLLSQSYDREVEILGNRPMTPVMINLSSEDSTLEEIIKTIAEHDTLPDWVNLSITPDEIKLVYVSF